MEMFQDCEMWWLNLELLPRNPRDEKEGNEEREFFFEFISIFYCFFSVSCIWTTLSFHLPPSSQPEAFLIDEL